MGPLAQIGIGLGLMAAQWAYHRWFVDKPRKVEPKRTLQLPIIEAGVPVPLIYGRVRVNSPILAWHQKVHEVDGVFVTRLFMVLGIPFADGSSTSRIHALWDGDKPIFVTAPGGVGGAGMTGNGGPETPMQIVADNMSGFVEFLNGNSSQVLANDGETSANAFTGAGRAMLADGLTNAEIPGYRGFLSTLLNLTVDANTSSLSALAIEASSYKTNGSYPGVGIYGRIGLDSNPINVIWDLFVAKFGKLGISSTLLDSTSFEAAALTLYQESHGCSCVLDARKDLTEHVQDILRQIDGVIYWDPSLKKICIRLVRNDYNPATIPHLTRANVEDITGVNISGWKNIPNKVIVSYTNRDRAYADDTEIARNPANAVGQDGKETEVAFSMPYVTNSALAARIASRELAFVSRPFAKLTAICSPELADLTPGQAVKLTWSKPDIAGVVFRVARIDRGTLTDRRVRLDLIQDNFYVHRNQAPKPIPGTSPPPPELVLG